MEPERRCVVPSQRQDRDNDAADESGDQILQLTTEATTGTPSTTHHPHRVSSLSPHASENSSAGSAEDTADDSFASVITVVPLQRVGRSLWQPPGSPGAAVDPPRASTDSFRSNRAGNVVASRSRLRGEIEAITSSSSGGSDHDPFTDSRSRAGITETVGSSTPFLGPVPTKPERAHTVQRGRETRRDLSGGRQSIETTPGEDRKTLRNSTHTTATVSTSGPRTTHNRGSTSRSSTNPITTGSTATSLNSTLDNVAPSSPLSSRADSTSATKDSESGGDDHLTSLTPGSKDRSVLGSIRRGMHNLGSIRGRKTPGKNPSHDDVSSTGNRTGTSATTGTSSAIKKKKPLGDLLGSIKKVTTPRPRAQAAFELQPFPSEQSMIGGLLLHGPQYLELAKGGDGRYATRDKNCPVFPSRLPLEPRNEPRRGDPSSGRFLSPGSAFGGEGAAGGVSCLASRSPRPDPYENKPLPELPKKDIEDEKGRGEQGKGGSKVRE